MIEKYDIIEKKWKVDWSIPDSDADIYVDVKVQLGVIADFIEEIKARHEIAKIISEQDDFEDPAVW